MSPGGLDSLALGFSGVEEELEPPQPASRAGSRARATRERVMAGDARRRRSTPGGARVNARSKSGDGRRGER
jgi:hypothetical protein